MKTLGFLAARTAMIVAWLVVATPLANAANLTPITITGFNRDVVVENTASGPPFTGAALNFNAGENTTYYQNGLAGKTYGLPASGSFTSALGDGTVFQFRPYTGNNTLVLSSDTGLSSGTLTLTTPAIYSRIAVIANSGNGTANFAANVTLTFTDATTLVTSYIAPDWFNNTTNVALQGVERIDLTSGSTSGATTNPRFYQTTINLYALLGATNKPLASLTFQKPGANSTGIYALSGLPSSAVTPPVVTNSPASNILTTTATLGGVIVSTGDEPPAVTMYYGPVNGGTSATAWSNNVSVGFQGGTFAQTVAGLSPNTTYYFTAKAVNAAGTVWAAPSRSFTTPNPSLPVVTNRPATSVTATIATLGGQVVSTGNDPPAITLYFGPADGGANAAAWASSVALGTQTGTFAQTIFGFSSNTTYYFTAKAVNLSGTVWASPSQSFTTAATPPPLVAVLRQHNNDYATGANLNEWLLNASNVNTNQFGLLYSRPVDDQIYAQPLIATNVNVPGRGLHNLVIVATVNDSVYAFDGDDPSVAAPYWRRSFTNANAVAVRNTDMTGACGGNYIDFSGNMGIVSTPVIDPATGTIYLVARTKENGSTFVQRLHALDLATGAERANSPVIITATYPGTGAGSVGGVITFDPQKENQRSGLALVNGVVYMAWASHCDWGPYHGWVMGYDATTLQRVVVYNNTPEGSNGGIWMAGQAPSADTNGNLYLSVGNGTVGTAANRSDPINRGESFLKLTRSGTNLNVASFFTPYNWAALEAGDIDLGSAGILLIPGTTLALSGGKGSTLYLVNRDNMGGLSGSPSADTNVVQTWQPAAGTHFIMGAPIWWDGPGSSYMYVWVAMAEYLRQYKFDFTTGKFDLPEYAKGPVAAASGTPGGILSLSAIGTNAGTGIIWASHQLVGSANQAVRPGILRAFNAQNVGVELWNSEQFSARDSVGNFAKFCSPTVANGKVYLATFSNRLNVYGLLPRPALSALLSGGNLLLSWPTNYAAGYKLQSSATLLPGNWLDDASVVTLVNGRFTVTKSATNVAAFYRLKL